ncbi:unnamed protein product [Callosobruchus maculatus]|uniref:Uncharacterized protein n=1 Tax=Callosobruchus maculatus TaxID=64391 RepID=A0A653DFP9_CALMS|nr:unnamed protein product [Callosobruchus maculatus]
MFCVYLVWLVYKFYNRWHNTSISCIYANALLKLNRSLERYKRKSYRAQQKNEPSTSQNRKQQQYKCWGHL